MWWHAEPPRRPNQGSGDAFYSRALGMRACAHRLQYSTGLAHVHLPLGHGAGQASKSNWDGGERGRWMRHLGRAHKAECHGKRRF
eukprot:scaffold56287_cov43-Tisochrysis_lutea.AAC.2